MKPIKCDCGRNRMQGIYDDGRFTCKNSRGFDITISKASPDDKYIIRTQCPSCGQVYVMQST